MADKQFLSILGLYNYDASIFDNLELPDNIDKSLVIDNILLDNAELSLVYTDYDFMKYAIGSWSRSELDIWNRLNKAFNEEYNPLWNVDEDTTETREIKRSDTGTLVSNNDENTTGVNINSVKGFNSNEWAEHDKEDGSSYASSKVDNKSTDNSNISETFNRKRGGNIGVTMSQQLLQAELDTRPKLNIYKYISKSFKKRFCNMIY